MWGLRSIEPITFGNVDEPRHCANPLIGYWFITDAAMFSASLLDIINQLV